MSSPIDGSVSPRFDIFDDQNLFLEDDVIFPGWPNDDALIPEHGTTEESSLSASSCFQASVQTGKDDFLPFALAILQHSTDYWRYAYYQDGDFQARVKQLRERYSEEQFPALIQKIQDIQSDAIPSPPLVHVRLRELCQKNDLQGLKYIIPHLESKNRYLAPDLSNPLHELMKNAPLQIEAVQLLIGFCPDWILMKDASGYYPHDYLQSPDDAIAVARELYPDVFEALAFLALLKNERAAELFMKRLPEEAWQTPIDDASWEKMKRALQILAASHRDVADIFRILLIKQNKTLPIGTLCAEAGVWGLMPLCQCVRVVVYDWPEKYRNNDKLKNWKYRPCDEVCPSRLDDLYVSLQLLKGSVTLPNILSAFFYEYDIYFTFPEYPINAWQYQACRQFLQHPSFPIKRLLLSGEDFIKIILVLQHFTLENGIECVKKLNTVFQTYPVGYTLDVVFLSSLQQPIDVAKIKGLINHMGFNREGSRSNVLVEARLRDRLIQAGLISDAHRDLLIYIWQKVPDSGRQHPKDLIRTPISDKTPEKLNRLEAIFLAVFDPSEDLQQTEEIIKASVFPDSNIGCSIVFDSILSSERLSKGDKGKLVALAPFPYIRDHLLNKEIARDPEFYTPFLDRLFIMRNSDTSRCDDASLLEIFQFYSPMIDPSHLRAQSFLNHYARHHYMNAEPPGWVKTYYQRFSELEMDVTFDSNSCMARIFEKFDDENKRFSKWFRANGDYHERYDYLFFLGISGRTERVEIKFYKGELSERIFSGYITAEKGKELIQTHANFQKLIDDLKQSGFRFECLDASKRPYTLCHKFYNFTTKKQETISFVYPDQVKDADEILRNVCQVHTAQKEKLVSLFPGYVVCMSNEPVPVYYPGQVVIMVTGDPDWIKVRDGNGILCDVPIDKLSRHLFFLQTRVRAQVFHQETLSRFGDFLRLLHGQTEGGKEVVLLFNQKKRAFHFVRNALGYTIAKMHAAEFQSLEAMEQFRAFSNKRKDRIISIPGCNKFAKSVTVPVPATKADGDLQILLTKMQQYARDSKFIEALKRKGLTLEIAQNQLSVFLTRVKEKKGIGGWHPEENKSQYEKLEIQLTHLVKKFLDSKDDANLRCLVLEYCRYGTFCSVKIAEIVNQFWQFSFGNGGDLVDDGSFLSYLNMIYAQAFNQTIYDINSMRVGTQEAHAYQCLRKIAKDFGYVLPYDPSLDDSMQDPDRDRYVNTGKEDFPVDCMATVFPSLLLGNLLQRFKEMQEELIKEQKWTVVADFIETFKQAIRKSLSEGASWIDPQMQKAFHDAVAARENKIVAINEQLSSAEKQIAAWKSCSQVVVYEQLCADLGNLQNQLEIVQKELVERSPDKIRQRIDAAKKAQRDLEDHSKIDTRSLPLPGGRKRSADQMDSASERLDSLENELLPCMQNEYTIYQREEARFNTEIATYQNFIAQAKLQSDVQYYLQATDHLQKIKEQADKINRNTSHISLALEEVVEATTYCDLEYLTKKEPREPPIKDPAWIMIMEQLGFLGHHTNEYLTTDQTR